MRAMQLNHPRGILENPLSAVEVPAPQPGPGEILLRVRACGLCHTDLHIVEGELPEKKSPLIPGHQIVGSVVKSGEGASRFPPGARVGVAWLHAACGACDACRRGEENLCGNARFTGYDVDGGFAEYALADERFAYSLPENFSDAEAAPLLCAGIIGYRALRLSKIEPGGHLGLYGFGASAHIAIQVARHWGCSVSVFTRTTGNRRLAEDLGAVWTGAPDELPSRPLDAAISFAPAGEIVPPALRALREGGTLAMAGIYATPIPSFPYELLYHEKILRSVANSTRSDATAFLRLAGEIPVRTETTLFPLESANDALCMLKESGIRGAGVLMIGDEARG